MRIWSILLLAATAIASVSCGESNPATPLETFKTYTKAIKQKDTTTMKLLLSDATIKMHEKEAKAQGVTVDDIVKRETLFSESQSTVEYRNEKIEGDKATLQIKTGYGTWETVPFVKEDGVWKIDKQGYAEQIIREAEEEDRRMDEMLNNSNMQPQFVEPGQPQPFDRTDPIPIDPPPPTANNNSALQR
jgi:hypothetical protein